MANGSTNIPSGSAPLFLGNFATNRSALAQKVTDRMISVAEKEKDQTNKDRAELFKALSFDAVEGLGLKVQEEHLKKLNELQDKWAKTWIDSGRKLSDTQRFQLQKDKTRMDQDVANLKHNVAMVAFVQQQLKENPNLYHPSSLVKLNEFIKKGNIGEDPTGLLIPFPNVYGYLSKNYGNLSTSAKNKTIKRDYENNLAYETYSNEDEIRRRLESSLQADPYYQQLIKDPYVNKSATQAVDRFISGISTNNTNQRALTASEVKQNKISKLPSRHRQMIRKYDVATDNPEELDYIVKQNDWTTKALKHDKFTLDQMIGNTRLPGGSVAGYKISPDGEEVRLINSNPRAADVVLPKVEWGNPESEIAAKVAMKQYMPESLLGKESFTGSSAYLFPDWNVNVDQKANPTSLTDLEDFLNVSNSDIGKEKEIYINGEKQSVPVMKKKYRDEIVKSAQSLLPDYKVSTKTVYGTKERPVYIKINDDETLTFDLSQKDDRKKFIDKVKELNTKSTTTFTPDQENAIKQLMDQNPDMTRDEIISELDIK